LIYAVLSLTYIDPKHALSIQMTYYITLITSGDA